MVMQYRHVGFRTNSCHCEPHGLTALPEFLLLIRSRDSRKSRLRLDQFAFPCNPLVLFICTFDAVFVFAAVVRELLITS